MGLESICMKMVKVRILFRLKHQVKLNVSNIHFFLHIPHETNGMLSLSAYMKIIP